MQGMSEADKSMQLADAEFAGSGIDEVSSRRHLIPVIKWHESLVLRIAASVVGIMLIGYLASIYIAVEGIRSITKIAHRDDIEQAMADHLQLLKDDHRLRQEIAIERLQQVVPKALLSNEGYRITKAAVESWLADRKILQTFGTTEVSIEEFVAQGKDRESSPLSWLDPERLRIGHFVVSFPRGDTYENFRQIESLRQGYKLLGETLQGEVQPAMIKSAALVLFFTFLVLIGIFYLVARRFKSLVERIIEGFVVWSETDNRFRFKDDWLGELKLITGQFNRMADEVEENRRKSLFLEKVASWQTIARKLAHEIKNPLTPIQMMVSQLARRYSGDDPEFRKLLDSAQTVITEEVAGLRRMVDNFSQFARLPVPQFKQIEMVGILDRLTVLESAAFPLHQVAFKTELRELMVTADEDLLRQVIINLVKNAAEACGEKPSEITIRLDEAGNNYLVTVQDNGPGIPQDVQARVFEAYFTTKHTGPNPGMGLGLAVCQKIVIDHGGEIRVVSRPGNTRFILKLPKRAGEH
jgi:signal transduction histidine kinase